MLPFSITRVRNIMMHIYGNGRLKYDKTHKKTENNVKSKYAFAHEYRKQLPAFSHLGSSELCVVRNI